MGRRQPGQETQQRPEGGQEEEDGTLAPLTPSPTRHQESNVVFPKIFTVSLHSESKLMRYSISADNGRMWGRALQGRRPTQLALRPRQGRRSWGRPVCTTKEGSQAPHLRPEEAVETHCPIQAAWSTPSPGMGTHPRPS